MFVKKIPDILTLCNLLCGCMSVVYAFDGHMYIASGFIFLAAVFDFLDGAVARLLRAESALGGELDSLADVLSFGLAPSVLAYHMLAEQPAWGHYWAYTAFIMVAASAYRLARFNTDKTEYDFFRGMPTPANAIFWASLALHTGQGSIFLKGACLLAFIAIMSFLLVCNFRMFSFKIKNRSWQAQKVVYVFVGAAIVLFSLFSFLGLAGTILMYPLFSWLHFYTDSRNFRNNQIS